MDTILVVNAGSSSVKFQVFSVDGDGALARLIKGQMDGVGTKPRLRATDADGGVIADRTYPPEHAPDVSSALGIAGTGCGTNCGSADRRRPPGCAWRPGIRRPGSDRSPVVARLDRLCSLAPLHQPHNLAPIRSIMANFPDLPQVACFDTAFHRSHGALADHYAIPFGLYAEGIRRYGFHGLSYEYVATELPKIAPEVAAGRVIVAHLGSGASMCALRGGRSVDSTMGFTALDGLTMGTRPGQIDPGVVLHLQTAKGMSASDVQNFLYRECGLKGMSGVSNDMRDLEASDDPHAILAVEHFVHRAALNAAMLAGALQGLDALVFTAGIGENSSHIRARIAEKLGWLGVSVDPTENSRHAPKISAPGSRVATYVVPTDEERMIARHTVAVLTKGSNG